MVNNSLGFIDSYKSLIQGYEIDYSDNCITFFDNDDCRLCEFTFDNRNMFNMILSDLKGRYKLLDEAGTDRFSVLYN